MDGGWYMGVQLQRGDLVPKTPRPLLDSGLGWVPVGVP